MFELVPSDWMRNYLKEQGRELSDKEKAALIWNAPNRSWSERLEALRELAQSTSDKALKTQIKERLDYEAAAFEALKQNTDGKFVYLVEDNERELYGVFADYNAAAEYAAEAQREYAEFGAVFHIDKHSVVSKDNPGKKCGSSYFQSASLHFDESGEISDFYTSEMFHGTISLKNRRFESLYFEIPFGMDYGIVKYIPDNTYYVLATNKQGWGKYTGRLNEDLLDFTDIQVVVYELMDNGMWSHEHINPLYLEPTTPQLPVNDKNQAAFLAAANALVEYLKNETEKNGKAVLDTAKAYAEVCHRLDCEYLMKAKKAEDIFC